MEVTTVDIAGLLVFTPRPFVDERGFFSRTFDAEVVREAGLDPCAFVQDSVSRSMRGVIRGLHVRVGRGEGKLVRCSAGAIFDVVVDLRPGSATFGRWLSFDLNGNEQRSIYVPPTRPSSGQQRHLYLAWQLLRLELDGSRRRGAGRDAPSGTGPLQHFRGSRSAAE